MLEQAVNVPLKMAESGAHQDRLKRVRQVESVVGRTWVHLWDVVSGGVAVIGLAVAFGSTNLWLMLLALGSSVPVLIAQARSNVQFSLMRVAQTSTRRRIEYLTGLLAGHAGQKELRLFNLYPEFVARWRAAMGTLRSETATQSNGAVFRRVPLTAVRWVGVFSVGLALAVGVVRQRIAVGVFVALFQATERLQSALINLSQSTGALWSMALEVRALRDYLATGEAKERGAEQPRKRAFPNPLRRGVVLTNVFYQYEGSEQPALRGVTLSIGPRERVAVVGPNGAGKSTLAKIILGLYVPDAGCVCVDGVDYADTDPVSMRRAIGAMFQDHVHFAFPAATSIGIGSIEDMAGLRPDMEKVQRAVRRAGVEETMSSLGYEQPLGLVMDGGREISGGEWQRVAIARASMRDCAMLVLDEPTSNLDPRAEYEMRSALNRVAEGRAVLIITHRLGAARDADRIIVMKDGMVCEEGSHDALLQRRGAYYQMWGEQAAWYQ